MEEKLSQEIRRLCEQAAKEQDGGRLMALVKMIIETYDAGHGRKQGVKEKESQSNPEREPAK